MPTIADLKAENKELKAEIKSLKKVILSYEKKEAKKLAKKQKDEEKRKNKENHIFSEHKFLDSFPRMYFDSDKKITNNQMMSCISKVRKNYTDDDKNLAKTFAQRANDLTDEKRKEIYENKFSRYSWIKSQEDFNSEIFEGYVNKFKKTSYFKNLSKKKSEKKKSVPKAKKGKKKATKASS